MTKGVPKKLALHQDNASNLKEVKLILLYTEIKHLIIIAHFEPMPKSCLHHAVPVRGKHM